MKKKTFNKLVTLARQEIVPVVDVADYVIAQVSTAGMRTVDAYRTYMWMSVASAAAAACIAIAATIAWQSQTDSVGEVLTYISWVEL